MMSQQEEHLLFVAKRAAQKLRSMYVRGEVSPRAELGDLIDALPQIREAIHKNKEATAAHVAKVAREAAP